MSIFCVKSGTYRTFIKLGPIGIKFARPHGVNKLATFLAACAMNLLERKRYLYYTKLKPVRQWGNIWKRDYPIAFNPTYFSCGLFNIVRSCEEWDSEKPFKVLYKGEWISFGDPRLPKDIDCYDKMPHYLWYSIVEFSSDKHDNIGVHDGKLYALDYGDFTIYANKHITIGLIDYA